MQGHAIGQIPIKISFHSTDSLNFLNQVIRDCFIKGTTIYNSNCSNGKNVVKRRHKIFDPDVIRTRSLLIWSQTRYHCATESHENYYLKNNNNKLPNRIRQRLSRKFRFQSNRWDKDRTGSTEADRCCNNRLPEKKVVLNKRFLI